MKLIITIILLLLVLGIGYYLVQNSDSHPESRLTPTSVKSTTAPILQNDSEVISKEDTIQQSGSYDTRK